MYLTQKTVKSQIKGDKFRKVIKEDQELCFRIMITRSKTSLFRLTLLGFPTVIRSIGRSKTLFPEGGQDFKQEFFLKEQNRHFVQRDYKDLGLSHRLCP